MHDHPDDAPFERFRASKKTNVSQSTLGAIDANFNGGLSSWKKRYAKALRAHSTTETHFNISVTQLYETYQQANEPDALRLLDKLIRCAPNNKCRQIFCPACRIERQDAAATKAAARFSKYKAGDIRMMTALLEVVPQAGDVAEVIKNVRGQLQERFRNNAAGLGTHLDALQIMGAFEVDLVNLGTNCELSKPHQRMMKELGFKRQKRSQYFVHLHAIVAPLDKFRQEKIGQILADVLEQANLLPDQLQFDSLHSTRTLTQNLETIARYMYKARLQFSDYVYENQTMHKKKRYHTPYKGTQLIDYLKAMETGQQFKGMKFEFGMQ